MTLCKSLTRFLGLGLKKHGCDFSQEKGAAKREPARQIEFLAANRLDVLDFQAARYELQISGASDLSVHALTKGFLALLPEKPRILGWLSYRSR
jgi:hypothetical protein